MPQAFAVVYTTVEVIRVPAQRCFLFNLWIETYMNRINRHFSIRKIDEHMEPKNVH